MNDTQPANNQNVNAYCRIIKTRPGSLSIDLINPTTNAHQTINFAADKKEQLLPVEWGALIFADTASGAYKLFKTGYFTFDNVDKVKEYAYKNNLLMGEVEMIGTSPAHLDEILVDLKSGKQDKIKMHLDTDLHKEDVARVAMAHLDELQKGVIALLEKELQISLTVNDE